MYVSRYKFIDGTYYFVDEGCSIDIIYQSVQEDDFLKYINIPREYVEHAIGISDEDIARGYYGLVFWHDKQNGIYFVGKKVGKGLD